MSVRLPGTPLSWLDKEIAKAEEERFLLDLDESRKSGLYLLYVAAKLIARAAGSFVNVEKIRNRLIVAMKDRSLPAYQLGQTVRWDGDMPIVSCLEIHWDDLNKWLENNESRIDKFPKPEGSATPAAKVEALPVATPAPAANVGTNKKTWDDSKLRTLWEESIMPGVTKKFLAEKHGVTRQRIGFLITTAKEKFSPLRAYSGVKNAYGQRIKKG